MGVGGHSYGAFMTANLLAHSNIFRAGIARSGAYNRSLTPFGFQNEDRSYWEAQEVYNRMAPFNYADKIKEPLVMIHGMADDNVLFANSTKLMAALQESGKQFRLMTYPGGKHGLSTPALKKHVYTLIANYFDEQLKPAVDEPKTLK